GMRAEIVTLGLEQVGGQIGSAVLIVIGKRRAEGRDGDPVEAGFGDGQAPIGLALADDVGEVGRQYQVGQGGFLIIGLFDLFQELRPDDAAAAPQHGDLPVVEIPAIGLGRRAQKLVALGVGHDLGGVKGVVDGRQEFGLVDLEAHFRRGQLARRGQALVLHGTEAARDHGLHHGRDRDPQIHGVLGGPLAGTLLTGLVEDDIDHGLAGFRILFAQDVAGDFDEVGVERAFVPFGEDFSDFHGRHFQEHLHHEVGFANELHVAVLDAIVDHLDVMAGAVGAHPFAAGNVVFGAYLGGYRLEDGLELGPGRAGSAGHDGRTLEGALLAAGDAHSEETETLFLEGLGAPYRIGEIGV